MELAYGLFMAETEGYLNTRHGRIQKSINDFVALHRSGLDINSPTVINHVLNVNNLKDLSNAEINRIEQEVTMRI